MTDTTRKTTYSMFTVLRPLLKYYLDKLRLQRVKQETLRCVQGDISYSITHDFLKYVCFLVNKVWPEYSHRINVITHFLKHKVNKDPSLISTVIISIEASCVCSLFATRLPIPESDYLKVHSKSLIGLYHQTVKFVNIDYIRTSGVGLQEFNWELFKHYLNLIASFPSFLSTPLSSSRISPVFLQLR
jgi:hypothetical protein